MILYNNRKHLWRWGGTTFVLSVFAVLARCWFAPGEVESQPGGSGVGLIFGILGGLLILFALSLSLLRFVPRWWFIGSRALWLKGHIWLGLLSCVLIFCHTGLRFGGFFEKVLFLVYFLVVFTGILGVVLQQFLPRWMTLTVPCEVPFEQIPNVCAVLCEKADMDMHRKCACPAPATCARIERWYADVVRPFLGWPFQRTNLLNDASKAAQMFAELRSLAGVDEELSRLPDLVNRIEKCYLTDVAQAANLFAQIRNLPDEQQPANLLKQVQNLQDACKIDVDNAATKLKSSPSRLGEIWKEGDGKAPAAFHAVRATKDFARPATLPELLDRLEEYSKERRRLGRQESLHRVLHGWLYVHVPLSWAMTVMMLAHAIMAGLYYHH